MSGEDLTYYRQRAVTERTRANGAPSKEIAEAHLKLAMMYENLLEGLERAASAQDLSPCPHTAPQPS
jgi:hypothetical protein